jgi:hypothetical protein
VFRTSDTVLIVVMVAAAAFTYKTKHDAETTYRQMRKIEAQIRYEQDSMDVLKADWSLLTQPQRLQRLTEAFEAQLQLKPSDPHQFVNLTDVPAKPIEVEDPVAGAIAASGGGSARQGRDRTVTGSVKP